jgi:hypothetical protein
MRDMIAGRRNYGLQIISNIIRREAMLSVPLKLLEHNCNTPQELPDKNAGVTFLRARYTHYDCKQER